MLVLGTAVSAVWLGGAEQPKPSRTFQSVGLRDGCPTWSVAVRGILRRNELIADECDRLAVRRPGGNVDRSLPTK